MTSTIATLPPSTPHRDHPSPIYPSSPIAHPMFDGADIQTTPKPITTRQRRSPPRALSPDDFVRRHTREFAHLHLDGLSERKSGWENSPVSASAEASGPRRGAEVGAGMEKGLGGLPNELAARLADEERALQEARRVGREKRRSLNPSTAGFSLPPTSAAPSPPAAPTVASSSSSSSARVVRGVRPLSLSMGTARRKRESISALPAGVASHEVLPISEHSDSDQQEVLRSRTPTLSSIATSELEGRLHSPSTSSHPLRDSTNARLNGHARGGSGHSVRFSTHVQDAPTSSPSLSQRKRHSVAFSTYSWATEFSGEAEELKSAAHYTIPRDDDDDMSTPEKLAARRRQVKTIAQTVRVLEGVSSRAAPLEAATRAQIAASYRSNFDALEVEIEVDEAPELEMGRDYGSPAMQDLRTPETPAIPTMAESDSKQQIYSGNRHGGATGNARGGDHLGQPLAPPPLFGLAINSYRPTSGASSAASAESDELLAQGARLMADRPWMRSGGSNDAPADASWALRTSMSVPSRFDAASRPSPSRTPTDQSDSGPFEYDDSVSSEAPVGLGIGSNASSFAGVSAWWRGPTDGVEVSRRSSGEGFGGVVAAQRGSFGSDRRGSRSSMGSSRPRSLVGVGINAGGLGFGCGEDGARGLLGESTTTRLMMGSSRSPGGTASGPGQVVSRPAHTLAPDPRPSPPTHPASPSTTHPEAGAGASASAPTLTKEAKTPQLKPFKLRPVNMERTLSETSDFALDVDGLDIDTTDSYRNNTNSNINNNSESNDPRQSVSPRSLHYRRALSSSPSPSTSSLPPSHRYLAQLSHTAHLHPHHLHEHQPQALPTHVAHLGPSRLEASVVAAGAGGSAYSLPSETSSVLSMTQALAMDPSLRAPPLPTDLHHPTDAARARPVSLNLPVRDRARDRTSMMAMMTRSHTTTGLESLTLINQSLHMQIQAADDYAHSSSLGLLPAGQLQLQAQSDLYHPEYATEAHGAHTRPSVIPLSNLVPIRPKRRRGGNGTLSSALSHFQAPPLPSPSVLFFLGFVCPLTWPIGGWVAPPTRQITDIEMAHGKNTTTSAAPAPVPATRLSHPDVWVTRCRYAAAVAYSVLIPGLVTGVVVAAVH